MTEIKTPKAFQVIVHQAKNLHVKSRNGVNDSYVTINLGKEKYVTSIQEKKSQPIWNEECRLISSCAETNGYIDLTVFHRGHLISDFLGHVSIPLSEVEFYKIPIRRWLKLHNKQGKKDNKERGELEVTVGPTKYLAQNGKGEVETKKKKRSASFKEVAVAVGSRIHTPFLKRANTSANELVTVERLEKGKLLTKHSEDLTLSLPADCGNSTIGKSGPRSRSKSVVVESFSKKSENGSVSRPLLAKAGATGKGQEASSDRDWSSSNPSMPSGVKGDRLSMEGPGPGGGAGANSHRRCASLLLPTSPSLGRQTLPAYLRTVSEENFDDDLQPSSGSFSGACKAYEKPRKNFSRDDKLRHSFKSGLPMLRNSQVNITFDPTRKNNYGTRPITGAKDDPFEIPNKYKELSKEELVRRLVTQEVVLTERNQYIKELENYIDGLLLKVMLETPSILDQNFKIG